MYKLLCLKWTYCTAQGSLLNVIWQPGWEMSLGENGHMYIHDWVPLLSTCVCVYLCVCVHTYSFAQWCPTLCTSTNHSPPCSSVHGTSQARILEWVAISYFNGSSRPRDWTCVSCIASRFVTTEPVGESAVHLKLSQYCSSAITQYKIRSLEKIKDQVGLRSLAYRLAHNRYSTKHNC